MNRYIFLDPDGTQGIGLLVAIVAQTGLTYAHQCGGITNDVREVEGFIVPLGASDLANILHRFFRRRFRGNPPQSGGQWADNDLRDLSDIVSQIAFWDTGQSNKDDFQKTHLTLDKSRLDELTEAWVPVVTVYGPGILMFDNSD